MSAQARHIIDPAKVRRYRLAAGYPERILSGVLGVSNRVIDRIEEGCDQSNLDVRFLVDLSAALGCTLADLLLDMTTPGALQQDLADESRGVADREAIGSTDEEPDVCADGDVAAMGALLASEPGEVQIDIAALALGWTRNRTLVALHELHERLASVGQRLGWLGDYSVRLLAAPVDKPVETAARRADLATNGIKAPAAQMIHQLIATGVPARLGSWDPMQRNRLINGGVLDFDDTAATSSKLPITLSDEARYALALEAT